MGWVLVLKDIPFSEWEQLYPSFGEWSAGCFLLLPQVCASIQSYTLKKNVLEYKHHCPYHDIVIIMELVNTYYILGTNAITLHICLEPFDPRNSTFRRGTDELLDVTR